MCINGGVDHLRVSANCGHTNNDRHMSTTLKVYWHDNDDRTEICEFVDATFKDVDMTVSNLSVSALDDLMLKEKLSDL